MGRKPRIEFKGAFYHVISRGNNRADIFHDENDFKRFLTALRDYQNRYKFILYVYTLMKNHFHLLIETEITPLHKIMQGLLLTYTRYYNKKYKKIGHLFQNRYKAILCDKDTYLLELVRYVHLNPVRAGLVENPEDYLWSSARAYLGLERDETLQVEFVLSIFSNYKKLAIEAYKKFVQDETARKNHPEYYKGDYPGILGNEKFFENLKNKMEKEDVEYETSLRKYSQEDIINAVEFVTGVDSKELIGKRRDERVRKARYLFVLASIRMGDAKRNEIAKFLHRDNAMISRVIKEAEMMPEKEKMLSNVRNYLEGAKVKSQA